MHTGKPNTGKSVLGAQIYRAFSVHRVHNLSSNQLIHTEYFFNPNPLCIDVPMPTIDEAMSQYSVCQKHKRLGLNQYSARIYCFGLGLRTK